jgi:hypothetical protein
VADEKVTIAEGWTLWSGGGDEVLPHCPQCAERHLRTGDPIESHYADVTYHSNVTIAFGCLIVVASVVWSLFWLLGLVFVGLPDLSTAVVLGMFVGLGISAAFVGVFMIGRFPGRWGWLAVCGVALVPLVLLIWAYLAGWIES